jgi:hypothetical protein
VGTGRGACSHLCELHIGWVPQGGAVRLLVAGVADELRVPDPKVVLAIGPLGKYGDGRPVGHRREDMWHGGGGDLHFGDILEKMLPGSTAQDRAKVPRIQGAAVEREEPGPLLHLNLWSAKGAGGGTMTAWWLSRGPL